MPFNVEDEKTIYKTDGVEYNKETVALPVPERGIGVDTKETIFDNIVSAGISNQLDMSQIESFTKISSSRDQVYSMLDTMCTDTMISAVLETYAEDATESNDQGQIVWCESSDANVQKYITFLLNTMNVDKHIYKWTHSLCKYGDVYLRLYRESDTGDDFLFNETSKKRGRKKLTEDVKIKVYSKNDHYVNYMEMEPNPAEVFELTRLGKTYAYIKAPVGSGSKKTNQNNAFATFPTYSFKKNDIDIHGPTDFVHASLEDNSSRTPEQIKIFNGDDENSAQSSIYTVKRGQSLLYNTFTSWRELQLLENSVLLNRLTKSSIVRIIGVEVGDMPKENIAQHLLGIKAMIEQKSALNAGKSMSEYTNPGPIENNIYVPTHNNVGNLTTQTIGGDVDVKSLADLSYYQDKLYGGLRVPKQFFGVTDDSAGFSGGQSLAIISSRYGKMVKRIQNTMIQAITDAINLLLIDKGLDSYVDKFVIRMQTPTTQEEVDRRENMSSKVGLTRDIMDMLNTDIEDTETRLKILKSLLSNVISNTEVTTLIQEEIDRLESLKVEAEAEEPSMDDSATDVDNSDAIEDDDIFSMGDYEPEDGVSDDISNTEIDDESSIDTMIPPSDTSDNYLPSPEELGQDMTKIEG